MGLARLKKHYEILNCICHLTPNHIKKVIATGDENLLKCVCECAHNVSNGNIPLTNNQLKQLKRHKQLIRTLGNTNTPLDAKRKLLAQKGGFLPALLLPVLSVVGGIVGDLIARRT